MSQSPSVLNHNCTLKFKILSWCMRKHVLCKRLEKQGKKSNKTNRKENQRGGGGGGEGGQN